MSMKSFFVSAALLFALSHLAALDVPLKQIPGDAALRQSIKDDYFLGAPAQVMARRSAMHTLPDGNEVQVRIEANDSSFTVLLARKTGGAFPGWAQGSWMLTRNRRTGEFEQIRIFLRSDPYTYIQLRPDEADRSKTLLDAVVYDAFLRRSLPLPCPFDRALTMSLDDILSLAAERFPARYYEPKSESYRDARTFIAGVRRNIGGLQFGDDGAIDEQGEYVYIATLQRQTGSPGLNCSGFAKWLIDGIIQPFTGKKLTINALKQPYGDRGSDLTRPWESVRDLFFGLDWTRNLAAAVYEALFPGRNTPLSEIEVRHTPFTQIIARKNGKREIVSYPEHIDDVGFASEGIQALLYTLAVDEPGYFYLAAISDDRDGKRPRLRSYFHVAALIPYFDNEGVFRVTVFESAEETQFSRFRVRYPGAFINLVRRPADCRFEP
jgi:hypothetical protein